jgi:hypothetical protein
MACNGVHDGCGRRQALDADALLRPGGFSIPQLHLTRQPSQDGFRTHQPHVTPTIPRLERVRIHPTEGGALAQRLLAHEPVVVNHPDIGLDHAIRVQPLPPVAHAGDVNPALARPSGSAQRRPTYPTRSPTPYRYSPVSWYRSIVTSYVPVADFVPYRKNFAGSLQGIEARYAPDAAEGIPGHRYQEPANPFASRSM